MLAFNLFGVYLFAIVNCVNTVSMEIGLVSETKCLMERTLKSLGTLSHPPRREDY